MNVGGMNEWIAVKANESIRYDTTSFFHQQEKKNDNRHLIKLEDNENKLKNNDWKG